MGEGEPDALLARDQCDFRRSEGLHAVIGDFEQRIWKIDDVSSHVHRMDRPRSVAGDFLTKGVAGQKQAAVSGLVALPHDIFAGGQPLHLMRKRKHRRSLPFVEIVP
jgi:hypothetical protein